jgi:hypothetical protein
MQIFRLGTRVMTFLTSSKCMIILRKKERNESDRKKSSMKKRIVYAVYWRSNTERSTSTLSPFMVVDSLGGG